MGFKLKIPSTIGVLTGCVAMTKSSLASFDLLFNIVDHVKC
jgi:hypothetical protein